MTNVGCRAALALSFLLAACGGDQGGAEVMDRDRFVAANIAVRTLPADATDADRAAALKKHRVSEKDLKAWVIANVRDPETLSLAWEEIAQKVDSITYQRPAPPPDGATGAPTPPRELPPEVRARRDSLARLAPGVRRPSIPRPGGPPRPGATPPSPSGTPAPEIAPGDPRVAPVQAPVAPTRPPKRPPEQRERP